MQSLSQYAPSWLGGGGWWGGGAAGTDSRAGPAVGLSAQSSALGVSTPAYDYLFKILLLGDSGVGKSSLVTRYVDDRFSESHSTTVGVDFKLKTLPLDGGREAKLQIWDTAGQERFRTLMTSYYRGAHGVVIVYDAADRQSFDSVEYWLGEVARHADPDPAAGVQRVLVANKCDLPAAVPRAEAEELAARHGLALVEASAKTGERVDRAFADVAERIRAGLPAGRAPPPPDGNAASFILGPGETQQRRTAGCCYVL